MTRAAIAYALLMLLLAAIGLWRDYPAFPIADIWDGGFGAYRQFIDGNWSALWAPHNEHRIIWTRLLLWADIAWLGETGFPVSCLILLYPLAASALLASSIARLWPGEAARNLRISLCALVCGSFALWAQRTTFIAPFQMQMCLAMLMPLAALTLEARNRPWSASLMALASLGSMANGIFTGGALSFMSLLSGNWRRAGAYAGLMLLLAVIYMQGMAAPAASHDLSRVLIFCLEFLGGAPARQFGMKDVAPLLGAAWLLVLTGVLITLWRRQQSLNDDQRLLLAFLAFLLVSCGTAALGRSAAEHGNAARYISIDVFAWVSLGLLALSFVTHQQIRSIHRTVACAVAGLIIVFQLEVLVPRPFPVSGSDVTGLAVVMGVNDAELLKALQFDIPRLRAVALDARAAGYSTLARYPYGAADGKPLTGLADLPDCPVLITERADIPQDHAWNRVLGHITGSPQTLRLLAWIGSDDTIAGYAIARPDARQLAFAGYLASTRPAALTAVGLGPEGPVCTSSTRFADQAS